MTNNHPPAESWEERIKLASRRCAEIIDLDKEPPVKYTAVKCSVVQTELEELDELHKSILSSQITQAKVEMIELFREKVIGDLMDEWCEWRAEWSTGLEYPTKDGIDDFPIWLEKKQRTSLQKLAVQTENEKQK